MHLLVVLLFALCFVLYFTATVLSFYKKITRQDTASFVFRMITLGAVLAHSCLIGLTSVLHAGTQLQGASILMLIAWGFGVAVVVLELMKRTSYAEILIPITLFCTAFSWALGGLVGQSELNEVYRSWPYLVLHVAFYMVASAFFMVGGIASALTITQQSNLKSHDLKRAQTLPSLSALKKTGRTTIAIGMPIYSVGLILGIMRAVGIIDLWFVSPRVLLAGALWLVVLLYLFEVYVVKAPAKTLSRIGIAISVMTLILAILSASIPMFLHPQV